MDDRLDKMDDRLDKMDDRLTAFQAETKKNFNVVNGRLDNLERNQTRLEISLNNLRKDMGTQFASTNKRIDALTETVDSRFTDALKLLEGFPVTIQKQIDSALKSGPLPYRYEIDTDTPHSSSSLLREIRAAYITPPENRSQSFDQEQMLRISQIEKEGHELVKKLQEKGIMISSLNDKLACVDPPSPQVLLQLQALRERLENLRLQCNSMLSVFNDGISKVLQYAQENGIEDLQEQLQEHKDRLDRITGGEKALRQDVEAFLAACGQPNPQGPHIN